MHGLYLLLNVSYIANFVLKFAIFRYHGNRGWAEQIFTYTVVLAVPSTLESKITMLSYTEPEL